MKPTQGTWWRLVCFSAAFLSGSYAGPVQRRETTAGAAAAKEDVNVLAFGVIQMTEALGQVKKNIEGRMDAIGRSLTTQEGWLWLLVEEAGRASEARRQVKEDLRQLQAQMAGVQAQSRVTQDTLARLEWDIQELWTRVGHVEEYLGTTLATHIKQLQERTTEHSDILSMLHVYAQYQRELLDGQNQQLSRLQQMSGEGH